MTKAELVTHLADEHPELIYPPAAILRKWSKDELEAQHAGFHKPIEKESP